MNAFDAVRSTAASLHDEVVELGTDSTSPMDLVIKAAGRRNISINEVDAEDPVLRGALAYFDEQALTIFCRNEGSLVERAINIAHEIGHVELHTGAEYCQDKDIDFAASIEQTPVGLERVTDYGARERRELQANVFAREFVLPLHVARSLYLDNELTTVAIAERTGLPLSLVRQQVLDAVLLPSKPSAPELPRSEPPIDDSQEAAAHFVDSAYNLQAGPGTGKTRTLVERVKWLIESGAKPESILVLTFSNRAAGELSERFALALPDAAAKIWTGTFHAFGLELTRRFYDRLGCSNNPRLFDRSDAIAALRDVFPTLQLKHYRNLWRPEMPLREILAAISRAKDELTDNNRYRSLASEMLSKAQGDAEIIAAQKCLEVALVYDRYETLLRDQDAFDFGDLIMRPALLLEQDVELRELINARYQHVLVDEYQDVNRASAHLLKAISGDGKRVWVVGDARQSIYRFRGASPTNLLSFETEFSGKAGRLAINYRSTKQIVDTFCKIAKKLTASENQLPLELKANRGTGVAAPEMRVFDDPDAEAIGIAESVVDLQARGVTLREQAVLCRTNARLVRIAAVLESRGIPVLHLGSLFERDDVRDLLALLSLAVDKFGAGLVRIGAFPRYALSLQDVYAATKWLREGDKKQIEAIATCAVEAEGLSEHGRAALSSLAEDLAGLTQSVSPWDFLCVYLLDSTNAVRELVKDESISGQMTTVAFWQFMNFVRAPTFGGTGSPVRRLLDRVRELVLLAEERGLREVPDNALHLDAVRLMTIHASKGLEFEAVHVPTLTTGSFPVSIRPDRCPPPTGMVETYSELPTSQQAKIDHDAEEDCLFFVAISRAKSHLRLYRAAAHAGGIKSGESRYVSWMAEIGIVPERCNVSAQAPAKELKPILVERAIPFVPDVIHLSQYQRCPRRFFYTHVLELGTAQRHTPFTQTHDVIHALLKRYKNGDSAPKSLEDLENILADLWDEHGPVKHEAAAEYQQLAQTIAASLLQALKSETIIASEPQTISFSSGDLLVEPDQMGRHADGRPFVRRMNTGKKRSKEYDRLEYAAYQIVSDKLGASFEASYLTDDLHESVPPLTAKQMTGRRGKIEGYLGSLKRGEFPPDPNVVSCPNCPHFFICDSVPHGALNID